MKRYIKSTAGSYDQIQLIDKQIRDYLGDNLILAEPAKENFNRGGYVYIFKINDHNVYRVFADVLFNELIFQCIAEAFYVDGKEFYDDAVDYKMIKGHMDEWFDLFKQWINECEAQDPTYTHYEYEDENSESYVQSSESVDSDWPSPDYWYDIDDYDIEDAWDKYLSAPEEAVNEELQIFPEPSVQGSMGGLFIFDESGADRKDNGGKWYIDWQDYLDWQRDAAASSKNAEEYRQKYREFMKMLCGI